MESNIFKLKSAVMKSFLFLVLAIDAKIADAYFYYAERDMTKL